MINNSKIVELNNVKTASEAIEKADLTWIGEEENLITVSGTEVKLHNQIIGTVSKKEKAFDYLLKI